MGLVPQYFQSKKNQIVHSMPGHKKKLFYGQVFPVHH